MLLRTKDSNIPGIKTLVCQKNLESADAGENFLLSVLFMVANQFSRYGNKFCYRSKTNVISF